MDPGSLALSADAVTAASGGANAAWLLAHRMEQRGGRRTAAVALAMLNAGIAVQAAFAFALFASRRAGDDGAAFFAPAAWLTSRALLLVGTLAISALIARRPR